MIRIQLVDDHDVVRAGLRRLLEDEEDFDVVAESASGEQAVRDYTRHEPDVVIMDLAMPGIGGLEAIRRIKARHPGAGILVLSFHDNAIIAAKALRAGARGYLTKGSDPALLVEAVRRLIQGHGFIEPSMAEKMSRDHATGEAGLLGALTTRELEVFLMLADGLSVKDIARVLHISPNTAGNHQHNIMRKLKLRNKAELARLAMQAKML